MNVDVYIVNEMIRGNYRFISPFVESCGYCIAGSENDGKMNENIVGKMQAEGGKNNEKLSCGVDRGIR